MEVDYYIRRRLLANPERFRARFQDRNLRAHLLALTEVSVARLEKR